MSVTVISPRMQAALRDNKRLVYFADIWTDVLNGACDTQAEWQANSGDSNMDYTTAAGQARLAEEAGSYTIEQTSHDTSFQLYQYPATSYTLLFQEITIETGRILDELSVRVDNSTGSDAVLLASIYYLPNFPDNTGGSVVCASSIAVAAGFNDIKTITYLPTRLDEGTYYIVLGNGIGTALKARYNSSDVYSGGKLWQRYELGGTVYTTEITGDMYFSLSLSGYAASGNVTSDTIDLGEVPTTTGVFQASYEQPDGTGLVFTAYGSSTGLFAGEETTYTNISDGGAVAAFRYWRIKSELTTNTSANQSPSIDMVEVIFPKKRVRLRENIALRHVDDALLSDYEPILVNATFQMSELKVIERLASGGSATIELQSSTIDPLLRLVSDSPLKNFRGMLYAGADVPDLSESDLLRYFIGVVDTGSLKPRFRNANYGLTLSCKNPILDLSRKVPQVTASGSLDLATNAISYDGVHALDAALDLMRGEAGIPARYINVGAILDAKSAMGNAWLVRRSNAATLVDTRLKSPEEVKKHLAALAQIVDGYWVVDESSRITFVRHDSTADSEEDWADEELVRAGLDAVPIQTISEIKLGYDDWLYNSCICGAGWDGSGGDWKAFDVVYAGADSDSAADFAPGVSTYWSLMEKNLLEASKWLDDAAGYNGEAIAEELSVRYAARFAYPPLRLIGVVVPVSQFMRTLGSVVTVTSDEVAKLNRRRISESETVKFMVTKKSYDRGRGCMVFDLMELTA